MQFWAEYGLFFAKAITAIASILVIVGGMAALLRKEKQQEKITVKKLNKKYEELTETLNAEVLEKADYKKWLKEQKILAKEAEKKTAEKRKKRVFVLHFQGDIKASAVQSLREEVSAILLVAKPEDEVVVCLESGGGMVSPYGLAASQLRRIKEKRIALTVIVDKIAASGGYLMACVADRILAAPFAIIGSIGVIAQLPNFHQFLKKHDIDFEQITAGKYKRTLTLFGENTDSARQKMHEDLEEVHVLFKDFILLNRPFVDMEQIATGEHWLASRAHTLKLVDDLTTSDDYLLATSQHADVYEVRFAAKKTLGEKLGSLFGAIFQGKVNFF
jgi:serine protease SohB